MLLAFLSHNDIIKAGIGGVCSETVHLVLGCLVLVSIVQLSQGHCGKSHR